MDNYVVYHLHSDLSNGITNIDSVTKFSEYIEKAKECGMKALGFSEHGSLFEWWHKKCAIEAAGMKYIHGIEAYLTETLDEKIRDNYHCVLMARNYEGFLELNALVSKSFNRNDNHFYYVPRISFDELFATSNNIIITTACVGGVLGKAESPTRLRFINFLKRNKDRCFLEIGHHADKKQVDYNQRVIKLHEMTGIPLIAGTDTHVLNAEHEKGRSILQASKNIHFDDEDQWDLKFKTFEQLNKAFEQQNSVDEAYWLQAIANTNELADMVEPFELDRNTKYPHIYKDPEQTFTDKIYKAIDTHPYALKNHSRTELERVVEQELEVYKKTKSIDFMLLQTYLREWEATQGIQCGYGRGSVSGSMIAYLLGITQMDSLKFGLNFFRFMNPSRVTNADIDTDYAGKDRDKVKEFLLKYKLNLPNIHSAEIITFNTIKMKGAIRDVCRAIYKSDGNDYLNIANEISKMVDGHEDDARAKYPEVFEYVDIVNGTIVSIGTHPSGVLISDLPINQMVGLCSVSTSDYPVSMINMKELDDLMYVKLDILGLDNIGVINDTCKDLGIERLTPDNTDFNDDAVWKDIRNDTTLIFQWESQSAQAYIRKFMSDKTIAAVKSRIPNFSMLKWMSFGSGLIRPACAMFRNDVAEGKFYDNGLEPLNEFLAPEAGHIAMQETIMQFLVKFCEYSDAESDTVRRGIAKKKGTEQFLPDIKKRFIEHCTNTYGLSVEKCEQVIEPFLQAILDASSYAFSWNHSDSYSAIGYICGYLRYYYPLEFLTAALNIFSDNMDKIVEITKFASKKGIAVTQPKWGISKSTYFYNKDRHIIAKGIGSVKTIGKKLGDILYTFSRKHQYQYFIDLITDLYQYTPINSQKLDTLIKIDYFSDFGNQRELLAIVDFFEKFKRGTAKSIAVVEVDGTELEPIVTPYASKKKKDGGDAVRYKIFDMQAVLHGCEDKIKSLNLNDLDIKVKLQNSVEYYGYVGYVTGEASDRNKLFVTGVRPVHRRSNGALFGYNITFQSIGSGKQNTMTVFTPQYKRDPIKKNDIIVCLDWERDGQYYNMLNYKHIY